ncbi:MAG: hypothetical protein NTV58_07350 [Deltaproteobacteria bacterium]|nr:hypothetical protein [Deltaproteobacteria bacterium]
MKKMILCGMIMSLFFCLPTIIPAAPSVSVEILYMSHGPLMPTVKEIQNLCNRYGKKITVSWHDFETPDGEAFMARKGIRQHVPLIIWINGKSTLKVKGKDVPFVGFPTGSGPAFFQGKWTMDDLRGALDLATGQK